MTLPDNTFGLRWARYGSVALCFFFLVLGLWHFRGWAGLHFWDILPGDRGDGRFIPFCLEHEYQSVLGHGHFTSPPFFYPVKGTLGYSDVLLGLLPLYSTFRLFGLDPFASMQGTLWLCDILSFLLTLGFLRRGVGFGIVPSAIGAAFYAFNHSRFLEIGHYQMQAGFFLPAAAWLIASSLKGGDTKGPRLDLRLAWALLLIDLQLLTSYYLGWFAIFWGILWLLMSAIDPVTRPFFERYVVAQSRNITVALLAFLVGLIPLLAIYLPTFAASPKRHYDDYLSLMPTWGGWFFMGASHPIEGGLGYILGFDDKILHAPEYQLGWGLLVDVSLLLFAVILLRDRFREGKGDGEGRPWMVPILASSLLLALMVVRWDHFSLWRWVFEYVPGCSSLRGLGRVATFLALPASMGLSWVCQRAGDRAAGLSAADRRRFLTVLFIFGLLALVEQSSPPPNTGFSGSSEWKYLTHFAQGIPRDCEAFYLRVPSQAFGSTTEWSLDAAWAALLSGVPTLHGYSGGEPPGWDLVKIKRASFRGLAEDWVQRNHLKGPVCEVAILGPAVDHVGP